MFKTGIPAALRRLIRKQRHSELVEQILRSAAGAEINVPRGASQSKVDEHPGASVIPHTRLGGLMEPSTHCVFMSR